MSTVPTFAAEAAREAARKDNGQFGEQHKADPGEVLELAPNEVTAQWHVGMSNRVDDQITEAMKRVDQLRATANKHNLAFMLYDAGVPAGTRILTADWSDEAEEYERFDVALGEVYDADGELLTDLQLGGYGGYSAGVHAGLGTTDWDEFRDDDGYIVTDKVYEWAEKVHAEAGFTPNA